MRLENVRAGQEKNENNRIRLGDPLGLSGILTIVQ